MTIADLEFFLVEVGGRGGDSTARSVLVRLATDDGREGWGEGRLSWRAGEVAARRDALLPALTGRSVFDIEELLTLEVLRLAPLRCAVETASWDLVGRAARQPLCHLFGGRYRRRIPLAVRLSGSTPARVAQRSRELADRGFHTQIIPSCGRADGDLELVTAVREMTGDRIELRLDACANYDVLTARDLCEELEPYRLQFVVDPLGTPELELLASLRRQVNVRLAAWRAVQSPADVLALVRGGAAPAVVVDLQLVGGLAPARKCASIAQAAGLQASLASGPSLGVGVAAMLQLAAATPAFSHCSECAYHQFQDDLLRDPLEVVDGLIAVPNNPGLGVDVDRARLERYQVT